MSRPPSPDFWRLWYAGLVISTVRWLETVVVGIVVYQQTNSAFVVAAITMVPYEQAAISFLAAKGNPLGLKKIEDLAGRRISVELGGIEEKRTREVADIVAKKGLKPVTVMTFNNFGEAFQALRAGQSDAATCIDATAMYQQQRGDFTRAISGVFPQTACFAFANKTLAEAVVGALNDLKKDGTYDKLLDQYGVLKIDQPTFAISGPGPA